MYIYISHTRTTRSRVKTDYHLYYYNIKTIIGITLIIKYQYYFENFFTHGDDYYNNIIFLLSYR